MYRSEELTRVAISSLGTRVFMILIRHLIQQSGDALPASFGRQRRATRVLRIICAVMTTSHAGDANDEASTVALILRP